MTDCTIIFTCVQVDEEKRQKFRSRMCRRVKVWRSLLLSLLSIGVEAKLFSFQNRQFTLGDHVFSFDMFNWNFLFLINHDGELCLILHSIIQPIQT